MATTRWIGPYAIVTRLDGNTPAHISTHASAQPPTPERRFIARSPDGDRTVLLSAPLPKADPGRFMAEADTSRYLLGPWVLPAAELAAPGGAAWHAR
ncbi:serine/threonine protein kinase, partial [Streptomyces sp. W16]|nr:serine/threonine protein kinase [Streptomyces sp. W16]